MLKIIDPHGGLTEVYQLSIVEALKAYAIVMSNYNQVTDMMVTHHKGQVIAAIITTEANKVFVFARQGDDTWTVTQY